LFILTQTLHAAIQTNQELHATCQTFQRAQNVHFLYANIKEEFVFSCIETKQAFDLLIHT